MLLWLGLVACSPPCRESGWLDDDGDGFGGRPVEGARCEVYRLVQRSGDCDDTDPLRNPDTLEVCDGLDQDCDGRADDGLPERPYWRDEDGDGFGALGWQWSLCGAFPGFVEQGGDCHDEDPAVYPGAPEACEAPNDANCDGARTPCPDGPPAVGHLGQAEVPGAGAPALVPADLDGDGRMDLVVSRGGQVGWLARGWGPWAALAEGTVGGRAIPSAAGGDQVLLVRQEQLYARTQGEEIALVAGSPGDLLGTSVDQDPAVGFLVGAPGAGVVRWGAPGAEGSWIGDAGSLVGLGVHAADLDGDGLPEVLAVQGTPGCRVAWRRAEALAGYWPEEDTCWWDDGAINRPAAMASGDLDGDGLPEVLVGLPDGLRGAGVVAALHGLPEGRASLRTSAAAYWEGAPADELGAALTVYDLQGDREAEALIGRSRGQGEWLVVHRALRAADPLGEASRLSAPVGAVVAWTEAGEAQLATLGGTGPLSRWGISPW